MMRSAYLLIAHGSSVESSNQEFLALVEKFQKAQPKRAISGGFLELAQPTISEAIEAALESGAKELYVIPLMVFSGKHVKEDIPKKLQMAKSLHPEVDFHYAGPIANHPMLLDMLNNIAQNMSKVTDYRVHPPKEE